MNPYLAQRYIRSYISPPSLERRGPPHVSHSPLALEKEEVALRFCTKRIFDSTKPCDDLTTEGC